MIYKIKIFLIVSFNYIIRLICIIFGLLVLIFLFLINKIYELVSSVYQTTFDIETNYLGTD